MIRKHSPSAFAGLMAMLLQIAAMSNASAYVVNNFWPDGDNIVMDDVFLPAATWSNPAQFQPCLSG